jgi:hypothetical protein
MAQAAIEQSLSAIDAETDGRERDELRELVAARVLAAGDPQRAEAIVRSITEPTTLATALTDLARAAATAGERERAHDLLNEVVRHTQTTGPAAHAVAQVALAAIDCDEHQLASELLGQAAQAASALPDTDSRELTLTEVAAGYARIGDLATAEQMVDTLTDPDHRATALADLAENGPADQAGRLLDTAERVLDAVQDTETWVGWTRGVLARSAEAIGDTDRADRQLRVIPGAVERDEAISRVVRAATDRGDVTRAETVARTASDPETRAWNLLHLMRHLPLERRTKLVTETLPAVEWTDAIDELLSARPDLVRTIVQEIDITWNPSRQA